MSQQTIGSSGVAGGRLCKLGRISGLPRDDFWMTWLCAEERTEREAMAPGVVDERMRNLSKPKELGICTEQYEKEGS